MPLRSPPLLVKLASNSLVNAFICEWCPNGDPGRYALDCTPNHFTLTVIYLASLATCLLLAFDIEVCAGALDFKFYPQSNCLTAFLSMN